MLRRGQGGSQQAPWLATAFKLTWVLGPSPGQVQLLWHTPVAYMQHLQFC